MEALYVLHATQQDLDYCWGKHVPSNMWQLTWKDFSEKIVENWLNQLTKVKNLKTGHSCLSSCLGHNIRIPLYQSMRSNLVRIFCLCYAVMIKRFPIMDIFVVSYLASNLHYHNQSCPTVSMACENDPSKANPLVWLESCRNCRNFYAHTFLSVNSTVAIFLWHQYYLSQFLLWRSIPFWDLKPTLELAN